MTRAERHVTIQYDFHPRPPLNVSMRQLTPCHETFLVAVGRLWFVVLYSY